jgi:HEAT repeat protein
MKNRVIRVLALLALCCSVAAADEIRPELAFVRDPHLVPPPPMTADTTRLKALWLVALKRPETEMQRLSAETIERAHRDGIPGMKGARGDLVRILSAERTHPTARIAAARTLIALDARDAAGELQRAAVQYDTALRQVIEPAVAAWDHQPMRDVWLARLKDRATHRRELLLALNGLAAVREERAAPLCLALSADGQQSPDVRVAAAKAAGNIADSGWYDAAQELAGSSQASIINRLCAVALLSRHRSSGAQQLLMQLAQDSEPAVAAQALAQLLAIDPELVAPLAEAAFQNPDANVRQQAVAAYARRPSPERVKALAPLLDDPHPQVRQGVREELFRLAKMPELDSSVREAASEVLAGESWRGQEQAAQLLTALDHKPAAARLVQLLESSRPEVMVSAAWGLRKLAVPETLTAILDKAKRQHEARDKSGDTPGLDMQVAHLFEALGLMKHAPAEPLLRQYIPKRQDRESSRCAAIWALGHLYAGNPDEKLAQLFTDRLTENPAAILPELPSIRMISAISLGRMKAASQLKPMRDWMGPAIDPDQVDLALRWAIHEITGETLPEPLQPPARHGRWFLEPLDPAPDSTPGGP